jgi:hypothetical protein
MNEHTDEVVRKRFRNLANPLDQSDWADVLRRAGSRQQVEARALGSHLGGTGATERGRALLLTALVMAAIAISAPAFGLPGRLAGLIGGGSPIGAAELSERDLAALSAAAHGIRLSRVPVPKQALLDRIQGTAIRTIAERAGRAYFVVDKRDGSHCYAVGYTGQADLFGQITCPISPAFPSPERPILDLAVYHGQFAPSGGGASPGGMTCCLWRLEGFAADGVASVGVETASGTVEAVTPVQDNVYIRTSKLPSEAVRAIVALDGNGDRVYTRCLARDGCGSVR